MFNVSIGHIGLGMNVAVVVSVVFGRGSDICCDDGEIVNVRFGGKNGVAILKRFFRGSARRVNDSFCIGVIFYCGVGGRNGCMNVS